MSFGIFQMGQNVADQALTEERVNRDNENRRQQVNEQLEQAEVGQRMSMTGTGAGIGLMVGGPVGALAGAGLGYLAGALF